MLNLKYLELFFYDHNFFFPSMHSKQEKNDLKIKKLYTE